MNSLLRTEASSADLDLAAGTALSLDVDDAERVERSMDYGG